MEFCICAPTGGGRTNHSCGTNIATDGLGRIPPYFCTATETSRDLSTEYIETEVNSLHRHKFEHYVGGASAYTNLPESEHDPQKFLYMVEVYVDDFMSLDRLGVARPFLMLKALFLILPLILPFKH